MSLPHTFFLGYACELTLCMLAFWSHEGVVFLDFLPSPHFVTSFLFACLGSTDALCPRLGDPVPLPPKWCPSSQGPRTLPYRDPEQFVLKCGSFWLVLYLLPSSCSIYVGLSKIEIFCFDFEGKEEWTGHGFLSHVVGLNSCSFATRGEMSLVNNCLWQSAWI